MLLLISILKILLGAAAILLIVPITFYEFSIPLISNSLARLRILFIPVEENTVRWIEKGGQAWRPLTPSREEDPILVMVGNQETWPMPLQRRPKNARLINAEGEEESWLANTLDRLAPGGVRYFGFRILGYHIKKYNFRWSVLRAQEPLDSEDGLVGKRKYPSGRWMASFAKELDYIYIRDAVYGFEVNRAETSELMPVDIILAVTMRVVDTYLPIFQVHDWMETILDLISPIVRTWVTQHTYQQVVAKREVAERQFDDLILNFTGLTQEQLDAIPEGRPRPRTIAEYVEVRYGIQLNRIAFTEVIPPKKYAKAATKRVEAEQNKIATITNAEAQRESLRLIGEGQALQIEAVLTATSKDPNALEIRRMEALENASKNGTMIITGDGANVLVSRPEPRLIVEPKPERTKKKEDNE